MVKTYLILLLLIGNLNVTAQHTKQSYQKMVAELRKQIKMFKQEKPVYLYGGYLHFELQDTDTVKILTSKYVPAERINEKFRSSAKFGAIELTTTEPLEIAVAGPMETKEVKEVENPWRNKETYIPTDEVEAVFKGKLSNHISENIKYPETALDKRITGTVNMIFIVEANGEVKRAWVSPDSEQKDTSLVNEAKRILISTSKLWKPAELSGKKVISYHAQPFVFQIPPEPSFEGFDDFAYSIMVYPASAKAKKIQGIVDIDFDVDENGKVSNVKLSPESQQKSPVLAAEAIRIVNASSGRWKPAMENGKPIRASTTEFVIFFLD